MKTYKIEKNDIKAFMGKLFVQEVFDNFEVRAVEINSFAKFQIEANLTKSEEDTIFWDKLKPYAFNIIKGSVLPKQIKIVFGLKKEDMEILSPNFSSCFLNMNYENDEVLFTTGTSSKVFSLNREEDVLFEEYIKNFFELHQIPAISTL